MAEGNILKWREYESFKVVAFSALCGGVFFLLPFWIPSFFGLVSLVSLFSPLPLIYATLRLGIAKGSFTVFLTTVVIASLEGPFTGLQFFFEFGVLALILSVVLERHVSIEKSILCASCITLFVTICAATAYAIHNNVDVIDGLRQWIDALLNQVVATLEGSGLPAGELQAFRDKQQAVGDLLFSLSPSLVLGFIGMISFLNVIMVNRLFQIQKATRISIEDLTRWRSPEKLVWCLIASGFCTVFHIKGLSILASNLLLLLAIVYFFQGLSIVAHFFRTWKVPRYLGAVCYFLFLTQLPLVVLVAITGLFDLWVNFRKL